LTDRATFEALRRSLQLRVLVSGDPHLLNTCAILADPTNERGMVFAQWFAEGGGRRALAYVFGSGKIKGFTLWPDGVSSDTPPALPFAADATRH
jgi:hypothetical protein